MSVTENHFNLESARNELFTLIDDFINLSDSENLRAKVNALIPAFYLLRKFGTSIISSDSKIYARERILIYLKKYPLTMIRSEELLVISGITDYQRRIRELRVEFGWPILGGTTAIAMYKEGDLPEFDIDISEIKPDMYIMLNTGPDRDAAHRWNVINALRKEKLSVKERLIKYFIENVGRQITGEELAYLAKDASEWGRRVRELRTEEGWPIKTRNTGRPDLSVGVYVLEDARQAEVHDRKIDDITRVKVLERDNFSCRICGWNYSQKQVGDPRQFLELHHLDYHSNRGTNTEDNLVTICNMHHDEIHRKHLTKEEVLNWIHNLTR